MNQATSQPLSRPFPRGALFGAMALIGLAVTAAAAARVTGVGTMAMPAAAAVETRTLRFEDRADGAIVVRDAAAGDATVAVVAPGTNGFIRGVLRGLARERKREAVGPLPPFRLTHWADGRLSLEDPTTGRRVELESFGPTNLAAFAQLLDAHAPVGKGGTS